MPKILIICDVYPPSFAPRMGYLVKYMKEWGWTADIVTRGHDGDFSFKSLLGNEKVYRVNDISAPKRTAKEKLIRLLTQKQQQISNSDQMAKYILEHLKPNDYSLILSSTAHRTFILDVASKIAEKWKKPWIADLRDIYEQDPKFVPVQTGVAGKIIHLINSNYIHFKINRRNKNLSLADALITVSPWHIEQLKKFNSNVELIYNGFDSEYFYPYTLKLQDKFNITYAGVIVSNDYRDPTFLFKAVKKLHDNKIIDKTSFRIQFYTPANRRQPILDNSVYPEIKEYVDFYDYVDTKEVPKILNESSILLLLTNVFKKDGPRGIMTTKYFEYLAVERPILCVRSDENILEESIKKSNAGISARTVDEAYDFILEKWKEWNEKGFTTAEVNSAYTKQFSRKLQAKQFVDIFEKIIN